MTARLISVQLSRVADSLWPCVWPYIHTSIRTHRLVGVFCCWSSSPPSRYQHLGYLHTPFRSLCFQTRGGGGGQEGRDLHDAPADVQPALVGFGTVAVAPGAVWMEFRVWRSYFPNNPVDSGVAVTGFSRFLL